MPALLQQHLVMCKVRARWRHELASLSTAARSKTRRFVASLIIQFGRFSPIMRPCVSSDATLCFRTPPPSPAPAAVGVAVGVAVVASQVRNKSRLDRQRKAALASGDADAVAAVDSALAAPTSNQETALDKENRERRERLIAESNNNTKMVICQKCGPWLGGL